MQRWEKKEENEVLAGKRKWKEVEDADKADGEGLAVREEEKEGGEDAMKAAETKAMEIVYVDMDDCSTPAQNPTILDVLNASIVVNSTAFRTGRLPWADTVEYLKNWILSPEHFKNPYPTDQEKQDIMKETGIDSKELKYWFTNNRERFWKPRFLPPPPPPHPSH